MIYMEHSSPITGSSTFTAVACVTSASSNAIPLNSDEEKLASSGMPAKFSSARRLSPLPPACCPTLLLPKYSPRFPLPSPRLGVLHLHLSYPWLLPATVRPSYPLPPPLSPAVHCSTPSCCCRSSAHSSLHICLSPHTVHKSPSRILRYPPPPPSSAPWLISLAHPCCSLFLLPEYKP